MHKVLNAKKEKASFSLTLTFGSPKPCKQWLISFQKDSMYILKYFCIVLLHRNKNIVHIIQILCHFLMKCDCFVTHGVLTSGFLILALSQTLIQF
jgi:hypothetical protein